MTHPVILVSFCLAIASLSATTKAPLPQVATTADLRPQHGAIVERWLASKPQLRLATEKDCRNKEGLEASRQEYGRDYQPYYATGDFNRDGHQDFAVALVSQGKRSRSFAIAIFNGPFGQRAPSSPAFFAAGVDLSEGGLVFRAGKGLIAGVFQSDDCVVLRPRAKTYLMKSCL